MHKWAALDADQLTEACGSPILNAVRSKSEPRAGVR
jgi:hypothetical protein